MNILRAAVGVLAIALLGVAAWAGFSQTDLHGGIIDQFTVITTLPWGKASMFDLFVGFALFAIVVLMAERSWTRALLWAAPIFVLGNFWTAIWLIVRLPSLSKRLNRPE